MYKFYLFQIFFSLLLVCEITAQCPPPGFPDPGDNCPDAPVLCENIDGYCATVNNNNVSQDFPGCPDPWTLNNDEWFAFFAGTTTIELQITPSNCQNANNQGLQGGIYSDCSDLENSSMDLQCPCTEDPFNLFSTQFVVGQIYWLVIDGCGGNVCDYTVSVLQGSTVPFPPDDPGPITGPEDVCVNETEAYSILPPNGATIYNWTLDPSLGTINGDDEAITIDWGGTSGTTQLCVTVANECQSNPTPSCLDIDVHPEPTATLSGGGEVCREGQRDSITITIDFTGDAPWTFTLSSPTGPIGPITTSDNPYTFNTVDIGSFSITSLESIGGCVGTFSGSATITEVGILVDGSTTTATCTQSNGQVDVTGITGGTAPYSYNWSNGEMTEDLVNVAPGDYTVTVTDANGCEGTNTFTVADTPNEPTVTATTTDSECSLSNGNIDVSVSGGTSPYTYIWGEGQTTEDLNNVPSGSYTVTVTGADGCTTVLSVDVANTDPTIDITANIVSNTTCNGGNGSITTTVTPTPPPGGGTYTYNWNNGETTPDLTNLTPGSYTVTVSTGNSCSGIATFTVPDEPDEPMISFTVTESLCELSNGSIDVTVSGGVTPYTFSWGNGETTEDLDDIPQGSYSVTVTGANGCTDEATINVGNNDPPITVTANIDANEGCGAGNWDGSITITISPQPSPTGAPYTINWNNGETGTTISDLEPGSYTVTVNGGGSCETIQSFDVPDQPNEPIVNVTTVSSECGLPNGSASISISGGVQPYTILWSDGSSGTSIVDQLAGSYSVTVTGANGCSTVAQVDITDEPIIFNVTPDITPNSACDPALADGEITLTVTPPTNNYTITWSNGETGPTLSDIGSESYTVTVSAGGNCEQILTYSVPQIPIYPGINISTIDPECGLSNGSVFSQNTGVGVLPFTYQWSNGETSVSLSNVPAGTYSVTVTGANGCSTVASGTLVDQDIPIDLSANVIENTSCLIPGQGNGSIDLTIITNGNPTITWSNGAQGSTLTDLDPGTYTVTVSVGGNCEEVLPITVPDLSEIPSLSIVQTPAFCGLPNGEADLTIIGGVPPYTIQWSNGETSEDLIGMPTGFYSVTVTTSMGCVAETSVNIDENALVFFVDAAIIGNSSCGLPNGVIELTPNPPGNPYTYEWDNGVNTSFNLDLLAGIYTVTVTAAGNCFEVYSFEVPDLIVPPSASATPTPATCGQSNGSVDLTVGGTPPYIFQWSNGASTEDLTDVPPGTYTVLITDANLCIVTAEATVGDNTIPINISGTPSANTSCSSSNGGVDISIDPTGVYTYNWSNGETTEDLSNVAAGTYDVTVSLNADCTSTASFTVEDDTEAPVISDTITAAICGEPTGAIDLTISGATSPYTFSWENGETTEDLTDLLPGSYTVTVTAANNCTAEATFNVANNSSSFSLSGTETPLTSCANDNGEIDLTITPTGTYTIDWSNGETSEDLTNLPAGTYTVTVTESGSCSASATYVVEDETSDPSISQNISPEICGQENGSFDITVTGSTTPYTFNWSNGATGEDLVNVAAGTYTVVVTGANGCSTEATADVPANTISFNIQGMPSANTSCAINNGGIDIDVTPAGSYTFEWSNGETTEDINGLAGGSYSVIVSAGGDCTASANFTVPSTTEDPVISQNVTPALCGESNGGIDLSITGGQGPFTFLWSNGETTEDLTNILADTYSVEVIGANGCVATANFTVPNNSIAINLTGTTEPNNSCEIPNGTVSISATPASNTYTYLWSNGETTQNLTSLPPGNYSVTVYEGATCEATANFTVGNDTNAPDITSDITDAVCGQANGSIDLIPQGGTMPYTFLWSSGETTEDLVGVPPGDYDVTITGADGCSNTGIYTVDNSLNNFSVGGSTSANTLCIGENGAIDLDVLPAGTYTYLWSNGETTEDLNNVPAGDYIVTVTDNTTCSTTATFTVENNAPSVNVSGATTDILCFGENKGEINVIINGGVTPYSFDWSPAIPGNPDNPTDLLAGDYTVVVSDASNCTGSATFTINQPDDAVQVACSMTSSVTLPGLTDGEAAVNVTGGTAPYTIIWTPGSTQDNVLAGNFIIDNLGEGMYDVLVIDANGCEIPCAFTINSLDCVTAVGEMSNALESLCGSGCITAAYDDTNQFLDPDDVLGFILHEGSINLIVGQIAYSDQPTFCFDATAMTLGTTYYISAVAGNDDGMGQVDLGDDCSVVSFGTPIVFLEEPIAAIEAPIQIDCDNPGVPLVGSSNIAGSIFEWSTINGVIVGNANVATIAAGDEGDYMLIVHANGCSDTTFVTVEQATNTLTASITADPTEILNCTIDAINLTGSVTGAASADYSWEFNGNEISTNSSITVNEGGTYTLTVTDPTTGCSDVTNIFIDDNTEFPPLAIDTPPVLNCLDSVGTLSGSSSVNGVDFFWATINGTDTTIIGNGPNVDVNTPGTYYLIGVAPNDCTNDISVEVSGDLNPPSANAGDDQSLDCYQTPIDLMGISNTANVDYFWTVNDPNIIISNPNAANINVDQLGIYTLTVTQLDNNCQAIDEVVVDLYENVPQAEIDVDSPDCVGDENGVIILDADPTNGPYEYSLNGVSNGDDNVFAPLAAGNYELVVTDGQGCTWSTIVYLPEPEPLIVELGSDVIVELGESVELQVLYTVPTEQLDTILWTPSELFPCPEMPCDVMEIFPTQQTSVEVTVIDTNGCEGSDILALFVKKDRQIYIPNAFSPNGDGTNDIFMIYSGKDVVNIKSFLVFSRWGESVFEYYDFVPNNPAFSWDGKHKGEPMNPAVFAWFAEVEFVDGQTVLFEGDVSLIR